MLHDFITRACVTEPARNREGQGFESFQVDEQWRIKEIHEFLERTRELPVLPNVRIPEREERRLPRQCNSQKGKFITDSSQGFLPQPTQWCRVRKSLKQRLLPKFIRYA